MEASMTELLVEVFDPFLEFLPFIIATGFLPLLIKFIFRYVDYDFSSVDIDIFTKPDIEEVKEPEKPEEVITIPVTIKSVSQVKEIPKFCPYCAGIPDNDERCSYCGIKF